MMSSAAFSQTDTNKKVYCFPDSIARKIAIDLVRGDSAKAELAKTVILVSQLEEKNTTNEKLINIYMYKVENYTTQVDVYKQKEYVHNQVINGLEKDVIKLKRSNGFFKITTAGLLVTTAVFFLIR